MNSPTPQAVDGYNRFFIPRFNEQDVIDVPTGFQSIFGRGNSKTLFSPNNVVVDIDIMRGNEKTAILIHRGSNARPISGQQNLNTQKYTSFSRIYPLVEEEGDIEASELLKRLAGEQPYKPKTRLEKVRDLGQEIHLEQIRRIIRLYERLAAQSLLDGVMDGILGTTNAALQYDFKRKATHTFAVSPLWDAGSATIMQDLDDAADLIRIDGHMTPNTLILGGSATAALINDPAMIATADNRRYHLLSIGSVGGVPKTHQFLLDAGFEAIGLLRTEKGRNLWIFTYNHVYTDSAGVAQFYMPLNKALVFSTEARFDRYYGPAELLPLSKVREDFVQSYFGFSPELGLKPANVKDGFHVMRPGTMHFDAYEAPNGKSVTIRTQSAAIFVPVMTDSIVTMTVTS